MNTYLLMAPDYSRVDITADDFRYFHARNLEHAKNMAAGIWRCDAEDITLIVAFQVECEGMHIEQKCG